MKPFLPAVLPTSRSSGKRRRNRSVQRNRGVRELDPAFSASDSSAVGVVCQRKQGCPFWAELVEPPQTIF